MSFLRRRGAVAALLVIGVCTLSAPGAIVDELVRIWGADELAKERLLTGDQLNDIQNIEAALTAGAPGQQVVASSHYVRSPTVGYHQSNAFGGFSLPKFDDLGGTRKLEVVVLTILGRQFNGQTVLDNESQFVRPAEVWIEASAGAASSDPVLPLEVRTVVLAPPRAWDGPRDIPVDDPTEQLTGTPVVFGTYTLNADFLGPDCVCAALESREDAHGTVLDGAQTNLDGFVGAGQVMTWTFDSDVEHYYLHLAGPSQVSTDPADIYFEASVVYGFLPEPGSLALLAVGAAVVAWRRKRRG
jgi:hypothetical protein